MTPGAHFVSLENAAPILAGASFLVLLILGSACANLGGLLMARGAGRQREVQLRFDLGAGRLRVFRQLLTENLLLGALGAVASFPLTYMLLRVALWYANAPSWMRAMPDVRVVAFTMAMGVVAALLFGLLPTLQMVRRRKERTRWHPFIVCVQVGASCVLMILSSLLVRATLHTLYADPGFQYEQVIAIDPGLGDHGFTPATAEAYLEKLQGRLRALPGVTTVSMAQSPPLVNKYVSLTSIDVDGKRVVIYPNWVGGDFFETMSIPLLRGRTLRAGEKDAVVLSESLARKRWPHEDPIGKQWKDRTIVVGVVGNTRAQELNNTDATEMYFSAGPENLAGMTVLVKTLGDPKRVMPVIQGVAESVDRELYPTLTPLTAGFQKNVAQAEMIASILSLLGGVAVFLAVVGLTGLVMYAVSQRTRELAIRLALGANRGEILSAVLRNFAWPVAIGFIAGVLVTGGLSQLLRRVLYGISGLDPASYAGAIALLVTILGVAALLPIRRAFRLDIARVLHSE